MLRSSPSDRRSRIPRVAAHPSATRPCRCGGVPLSPGAYNPCVFLLQGRIGAIFWPGYDELLSRSSCWHPKRLASHSRACNDKSKPRSSSCRASWPGPGVATIHRSSSSDTLFRVMRGPIVLSLRRFLPQDVVVQHKDYTTPEEI